MSKAFGFKGYGGPEVQAFMEVPKPVPGPSELLVAVRAAGVNPADWKVRSGFMREVFPLELPAVFGYEVAHSSAVRRPPVGLPRTGVPFPPYPGKGTPVGAGPAVGAFWRSLSAVFR